jgi:hypothetical protein
VVGFGEEEAGEEGDEEDARSDEASGEGDLVVGVPADHGRDKSGGEKGGAGSDHPATDIGGEAGAGAAEVEGEDFGKVFAEEAELADDEEAAEEDCGVKGEAAAVVEVEIGEGEGDERGADESLDDGALSESGDEEEREEDSTGESAEFLGKLGAVAACLDDGIEGFDFFAGIAESEQDFFAFGDDFFGLGMGGGEFGEFGAEFFEVGGEGGDFFGVACFFGGPKGDAISGAEDGEFEETGDGLLGLEEGGLEVEEFGVEGFGGGLEGREGIALGGDAGEAWGDAEGGELECAKGHGVGAGGEQGGDEGGADELRRKKGGDFGALKGSCSPFFCPDP